MKGEIIEKLGRIESDHGIEIPLACEAGSRAWGFESPDSDYDVRFIYSRPLAWYLAVHERRDVIELPLAGSDLDFSGWDLKKVLFQIYRGNPALFEWFNSPTLYFERFGFLEDMKNLTGKYFNPRAAIYHYLHMASGNYREYLKSDQVRLKKYFYVLRPLLACQWIKRHNTMPPAEYVRLILDESIPTSTFPFEAADKLLAEKKVTKELGTAPRVDEINIWIEDRLAFFSEIARTTAKVTSRPDDLDEYLYNWVRK